MAEKRSLPDSKQDRLEYIIEAVWEKLYTHDYKYAADTILKAMDMQGKLGLDSGKNENNFVVELPAFDQDE